MNFSSINRFVLTLLTLLTVYTQKQTFASESDGVNFTKIWLTIQIEGIKELLDKNIDCKLRKIDKENYKNLGIPGNILLLEVALVEIESLSKATEQEETPSPQQAVYLETYNILNNIYNKIAELIPSSDFYLRKQRKANKMASSIAKVAKYDYQKDVSTLFGIINKNDSMDMGFYSTLSAYFQNVVEILELLKNSPI